MNTLNRCRLSHCIYGLCRLCCRRQSNNNSNKSDGNQIKDLVPHRMKFWTATLRADLATLSSSTVFGSRRWNPDWRAISCELARVCRSWARWRLLWKPAQPDPGERFKREVDLLKSVDVFQLKRSRHYFIYMSVRSALKKYVFYK